MDNLLIQKHGLNELTEEALRQYLVGRESFTLDYTEHHRYIDLEDQLINRSVIQEVLNVCPEAFSETEIKKLKSTDQFVLDNVKIVAEWVHNLYMKPDEPRSEWWWYLDEINAGMMETPDLDCIFSEYEAKLNT